MAEQQGNTAGAGSVRHFEEDPIEESEEAKQIKKQKDEQKKLQENENPDGKDHVEEEEAQANREGQGATAGAAAGEGYARPYTADSIPENATVKEYKRSKREQKKIREEERRANPDILFFSERSGEEDKLQFYSKKQDKWLKLMRALLDKKSDEETITCVKLKTKIGTIMSYSTGEFVISGSKTERHVFKKWFQVTRITMEMENMTIQNNQNHQAEP